MENNKKDIMGCEDADISYRILKSHKAKIAGINKEIVVIDDMKLLNVSVNSLKRNIK